MGISLTSFERHVQPELRLVRRGKLRLIPVREIERWLDKNAEAPLAELRGAGTFGAGATGRLVGQLGRG